MLMMDFTRFEIVRLAEKEVIKKNKEFANAKNEFMRAIIIGISVDVQISQI